jgi:hypothetical protein
MEAHVLRLLSLSPAELAVRRHPAPVLGSPSLTDLRFYSAEPTLGELLDPPLTFANVITLQDALSLRQRLLLDPYAQLLITAPADLVAIIWKDPPAPLLAAMDSNVSLVSI